MQFSVIIPTYNRSNFLGEVIASVCNQSLRDCELIIVDDGSTDNTRELVASVMTHQVIPIQYIYQDNKERGAARNRGIKEAKGDFIYILDSDDLLLPNHLEIFSKSIADHPDIAFFSGYYRFFLGEKLRNSTNQRLREGLYDYRLLLKGNPIGCNVCFRRNHKGLVLFNEDRRFATMEDWIFLTENLRSTSLFLIPDVTLYVRDHENRSMNQNKTVITRRLEASEFIKKQLPLTANETRMLDVYTYYFCAIHSYLDEDYAQARSYIRKTGKFSGLGFKLLLLNLKVLLGRKNIEKLKRIFK
jgi:glycosyltransferase involved in cell wall biosynthesis